MPVVHIALSEPDITAVMEASSQYGSSIVSGDFATIRSLMHPEIVLMPPGEPALQGIDAAVQSMEQGPAIEGSINPDQVNGSGEMAYVSGTYSISFMLNDTVQVSDNGKYLELWKKQEDGSWKVAVDIWNSSASPEM